MWRWLVLPISLLAVFTAPTVQELPAPDEDDAWPVPAAAPSDVERTVSMRPAPSAQAAQAFEQGVAMMDGVRGPLRIVEGPADIVVHWVQELRGGQRLGQHVLGTPRIDVALGDRHCQVGWTPYDAPTMARVVAHEIGHALGLEHDGSTLMSEHLPAGYAGPCVLSAGATRMLPWQVLSVPVHLGSEGQVAHSVTSTRAVDVCITPAQSTALRGWGCHAGQTEAEASVRLPPGSYRLAIRCVSLLGCDVQHELGTRPLDRAT